MPRKTQRKKRSRALSGGHPRSVCPTLKTADGCSDVTICKWNSKLSKCRKAPGKRTSVRQAEKTLKCMSYATKHECTQNKCLWGNGLGCTAFAPRPRRVKH